MFKLYWNTGAGAVEKWVKPPPVMLQFCLGASSCPHCYDTAFLRMAWERHWNISQAPGPCSPRRRWWGLRLLAPEDVWLSEGSNGMGLRSAWHQGTEAWCSAASNRTWKMFPFRIFLLGLPDQALMVPGKTFLSVRHSQLQCPTNPQHSGTYLLNHSSNSYYLQVK